MIKNINSKGVTLVELAIVIVIIGLLLSGVLVGEELIKQSEIQKDISMLNNYRASMETFRLKYNKMPGDFNKGTTFWPDCSSITSDINPGETNCDGDGNDHYNNMEWIFVFYHLFRAGLSNYAPPTPRDTLALDTFSPRTVSTAGQAIVFATFDVNGSGSNRGLFFNFKGPTDIFMLVGVADVNNPYTVPIQKKQKASVLSSMDSKIDDGAGNTGTMRAIDPNISPGMLGLGAADDYCVDTDGVYRVALEDTCIGITAIAY